MSILCTHCQSPVPAGSRYCGNCGGLLAAQSARNAETRPAADLGGERRHLTVMFCDLAGSTALSELLDPEDFRELLSEYLEAAVAEVKRHSGFIGQYLGDGILTYFGYPNAREDSPLLAVRAALGILGAMDRLQPRLISRDMPRLQVRIGIHTGLLVIGEHGSMQRKEAEVVIGRTPNLAARLQSVAEPGTVAISEDTWRLVRGHFRGEALGRFELKGIAEPVAAFKICEELEHAVPPKSTGADDMVGRSAELAGLLARWARVIEGSTDNVLVTGEPGIGKSRLLREFERATAGTPRVWLSVRGLPHSQESAFQPVIDLLRRLLGFSRHDTAEEQVALVEKFVSDLGLDPRDSSRFLLTLLSVAAPIEDSLSSTGVRERLFTWMPELLRALASRQPVAFIVEDLHWLDPSTLEVLQRLEENGPLTGVLQVYTCRTELAARWAAMPQMPLDRLSSARVRKIMEQISGGKELPEEIVQQVVRKADGVPLFVEEMTKMALESGLLIEGREHYESVGPMPPIAIPDTLHALLMARLDRTTGARELAQIAAVLGQEFHLEMLRAVCSHPEDQLTEGLDTLVDSGILTRIQGDGDVRFHFHHALIQEEAYQSMLKRKRQQIHRQVADLLTERFAGTLEAQPELVARHYTEAGHHEHAVEYWLRAAQRSIEKSASYESIAQARRGLALLPELPEGQLRMEREMWLMSTLGRAMTLAKGYGEPEAMKSYSRARDLGRELGDAPVLIPLLASLFGYYLVRAEFPTALEVAHQIERLGLESDSLVLHEHSFFSLGAHAFYTGDLERSIDMMQRGIAVGGTEHLSEDMRTLDLRVGCGTWCAMAMLMQGRADEAAVMMAETLAHAEKSGHPHSLAFARHLTQTFYYWRDEPERLLEGMDTYKRDCQQQAFSYWIAMSTPIEGWARLAMHDDPRLLEMIQRGVGGIARTGTRVAVVQHYAPLVLALATHGRLEEARAALKEVRTVTEETGEKPYAPMLPYLEAVLALHESPPDLARAEVHHREALAMAREFRMPWQELRPVAGLAALLRESGRNEEARQELTAVRGKFTQGLNSPLLRRVETLLAELGG